VATQVTMDDGSEHPLLDHLRDVHKKGTRGFTEEYLHNLHQTLHQRRRDPLPEHTHPEDGASAALGSAGPRSAWGLSSGILVYLYI
jgi:hypothetical protein